MTNEEKQLLLKDLCARLPYGVKCHFKYGTAEDVIILKCIDGDIARFNYGWYGEFHVTVEPKYIKPYLRPMSSMTKNEEQEIRNFFRKCIDDLHGKSNEEQFFLGFCQDAESLDYLNMHHFDYRGLIEKGLALEAPEGMYNTKTE